MKTYNRSILTLTLGCMLTAAAGCDTDQPTPDTEQRQVVFHADEILATLEANPEATFFVDLREPVTYTFDQPDTPIELSHFTVQCPSMTSAIPMNDFVDMLELDSELDASWWSLGAADADAFRGPFQQDPDGGGLGGGCSLVCPGGVDCAMVCEAW
ncbi:MAG: hypothetical protein K0V04_45160 [Deltaproteobacteria bacterium]|nr:hypothetical protein [Deltaproteobacteria bacterium]